MSSTDTLPPNTAAEDRPSLLQAPAACPFSGVAIDPRLWESFQAKLASNGAHRRHHSETKKTEEEVRSMLRQDGDDNSHQPLRLFLRGSETNSYRVSVVNESTKRSKDLVLDRSKNGNLFDAVYDHSCVKDAHIRKWGSEIAKDVRSGNSEIRVKVVVGDGSRFCWWLTVDEMKEKGTEDLYQRIGKHAGSEDIKIYLVCLSKGNTRQDSEKDEHSIKPARKRDTPNQTKSCEHMLPVERELQSTAAETAPHTKRYTSAVAAKNYTFLNRFRRSTSSNSSENKSVLSLLDESSRMAESEDMADALYGATSSSASDGLTMSVMDTDSTSVLDLLTPVTNQAKTSMGVRVINQSSKRSKDLVLQINDTDTVFDAVYDHPGVKAAHVRKWGGSIANAVKNGTSEIQVSVWDDDTDRPWRVFSIDELKSTTTRQLYELVSESSNLITVYLQCVCTASQAPVSGGNLISDSTAVTRSRLHASTGEVVGSPSTDDVKSASSIKLTSQNMAKPQTVQRFNMKITPRRPSLRLEKDGRPRFSIDTQNSLTDRVTAKKPGRTNHMKLAAANLPRTRSFPTVQKAMTSSAGTLRRIGSYSLLAIPPKRLQTQRQEYTKQDAVGFANTSLQLKKNSPAPNRLISVLGHSTRGLMAVKEPCQDAPAKMVRFPEKQATSTLPKASQRVEAITRDVKAIKIAMDHKNEDSEAILGGNEVNTECSSGENDIKTTPAIACDLALTSPERAESDSNEKSLADTSCTEKIKNFLPQNQTKPKEKSNTSDKIARFLASRKVKPASASVNTDVSAISKDIPMYELELNSTSLSTQKSLQYESDQGGSQPVNRMKSPRNRDMPPVKEISVMASDSNEVSATVSLQGVSLPAEVVKDVFPYHVVLDVDFCIIQVGNNLETLVKQSGLVGRFVNEIMTVTSPISMIHWDWTILEKMKDKTMFLETVSGPSSNEKRKLKGTIIEVSKSPKQVMLALVPNVKNLAELEDANLSMADLPLHSCQRETVLFGEHSKSEVNLTNHLDKLHRDLIDSMEQQIKDRTEELAAAFRNLEAANSQLAIQSARQLEHFACTYLSTFHCDVKLRALSSNTNVRVYFPFLPGMSHEIRTPLNCIVGMSSLLLDDAEEMDPMHAESIQMINTSGDLLKVSTPVMHEPYTNGDRSLNLFLQAVVDDVLDYAKLESGSFEVDIKKTNLQHTLNSVAHSMSEKMREKNVRLRLYYSPFLPEVVETDSRRLQQVLFNLLGNAGKFSKNNSVIDLTVSLVPVDSTGVDPAETSNGEVIRFEVKDYGKGIESKDFQTIFEPFSQASKETQTLYGGTGLGLSITSKLVHRLGGTISLKSEYGKFAEFTVHLPMRGRNVDIPRLQKMVQNTTIVLVEKPDAYDYSFTDYAIKPEPIPFNAEMSEAYNVDVERCMSLGQAFERIKNDNLVTPAKHYAFLVHEDLYQFELGEKLDNLLGSLNYTLMTFGPKFSVEVTKERHFKSLSGVFASSLLEKIAGHVERRKREKISSNPNSSTINLLMSKETIQVQVGINEGLKPPLTFTAPSGKANNSNAREITSRVSLSGNERAANQTPRWPFSGFSAFLDRGSSTQNGESGLSDPGETVQTTTTGTAAIQQSDSPHSSGSNNSTGKKKTASSSRRALKVLYAGKFYF